MDNKTDVLETLLTSLNKENDLDKFLNNNKNNLDSISFTEYFSYLYTSKGIKKSSIVNESNLSRSYCYEVLRGDKVPDRDSTLKLCFAAKLNLEETNKILKLTNNGPLYPKLTRDVIIIFCINNNYTLMQVDSILYEKGLATLEKE